MTRLAAALVPLAALVCALACAPTAPPERYGFLTRLGRDTIAVESVTRSGDAVTIDAVDRFPRVRRRHAEVTLGPDGAIRRLVMDVHTPSEPASQRERRVVAEVTADSVRITKTDAADTVRRAFATQGGTAMAHVPQMYSLYELYFAAALRRAARDTARPVRMRQFYVDRDFDGFPLHRGVVRPLPDGRAEIMHDWLSGTGEATLDSAGRLLAYSGARTTYDVRVTRLATLPDVGTVAAAFERAESRQGGARSLSVRDTVRAQVGGATLSVDYGRPLARGRVLLGDVIPYGRVWRTGANAATQLTTSAPITLAGLALPAGTYTLWTLPRADGVELIVNRQTGQWGTGYGPAHDLGHAAMTAETRAAAPVEQFTIAIDADERADERASGRTRGTLSMAWGPFRWTAPIVAR